VTASSYVNFAHGDVDFFAAPCEFGPEGVTRVVELGKLTEYEVKRLEQAKAKLKGDIAAGKKFAPGS
jgi:malate/lactate dehydrogenase